MPAPAASREEVVELLGEVDDLIVERVLETGASVEEIAEALDTFQDEHQFGEQPHTPSSTRVVEVRSILSELPDDVADDDMIPIYGEPI
ncbi:MAG: hypothetical protein H0T79_13050 [Deltaproteobacteria bacterium]|nr:hypothetical protein [Deltaproteobacteria bacterium]